MRPLCQDCGIAQSAVGRSRCWTCYYAFRANDTGHASPMRVLLLDIETSPNLVYAWGLFKQNIGVNQIVQPGGMLCFSAKWLGGEENQFYSSWEDGHHNMIAKAWGLLNEADAVVHYYGSRFDIPHLNREFLHAGYSPPSPYKQIDLKNAVAKQFKFPSNKLQHVSTALGLEGKMKHEGFDLWTSVMDGDEDAQARMEAYNRQDVNLLEELYYQMLPWIPQLPNRNLYDDESQCPFCGGQDVSPSGFYFTALSKYRKFLCNDCGGWLRASKRESGVTAQGAVIC